MGEREQGGSSPRLELTTGRLEAFSDAVIAVIMTILALELRPPAGTTRDAVEAAIPGLSMYVLAFVYLAIWWNNHHHLLQATERIDGAVMWANMALLFFLSLIPVATEWTREIGIRSAWPPAFFGLVSLAAAIAYTVLVRTIVRANGPGSLVARSLHGNAKGIGSIVLYAVAVLAAIVTNAGYISYALYTAVAIIWLVPDRRLLHDHPS
jgi:TMEM175 potassium channel family protein